MGFYRIHLLEVVTLDFLLVPIIMTGGGLYTMTISLTGMAAIVKEDSCWLVCYSVMTGLNFFILLAGVISSVRKVTSVSLLSPRNARGSGCWLRFRSDFSTQRSSRN